MKSALTLFLILAISGHSLAQDMKFSSITSAASLKRGKNYQVNWNGGKATDMIAIHLVDQKGKQTHLSAVQNSGSVTVSIPSRTKPGMYTISIVNSTSGELTSSSMVTIRRKIPLVVQIIPVLVAPVVMIVPGSRPNGTDELPSMPEPNPPN